MSLMSCGQLPTYHAVPGLQAQRLAVQAVLTGGTAADLGFINSIAEARTGVRRPIRSSVLTLVLAQLSIL